jgi:hypothetical protein
MKRTPSHRLLSLCIVLAVASVVGLSVRSASAFSYYLVDGWPVIWNPANCARFLSPGTFAPDSEPDQLIRAAMGEWNFAPAIAFSFSYFYLDQDYPVDHFDGYNDTTAVPTASLDPGVLGVTYLVNDGSYWFDTDIVFSDFPGGVGYHFDAFPTCDMLAAPSVYGYSFLLIALHELGHGLGLGHEPMGNESAGFVWFPTTMNPRYPSGGTLGQENIIELHANDRNGIRFLYPHTGQSTPRTDLANAMFTAGTAIGKAVPVYAEPPSVGPGEEVFLQSVIENLGTTSEFSIGQGFYLSLDPEIETSDTFLGALLWDLGFGQALQFEVATPLPEDMAAGEYYLGSVLDDLDEIPEMFEDNNAVSYCEPLTIERLIPDVLPLTQQLATCGQLYRSQKPQVTHPLNMAPITWSLVNPQPGMTIRATDGQITWPSPAPSTFPYNIQVKATNSSGNDTQTLSLGVERLPPVISPMSNATIACGQPYLGPAPALTSPTCMNPVLLWSLTSGPPGMTVNPDTGVVSWPMPVPSSAPYGITLRAINSAGHGSVSRTIGVPIGDLNADAALTAADLGPATGCLTGPATVAPPNCRCADADADGDVDLRDARALQTAFGR